MTEEQAIRQAELVTEFAHDDRYPDPEQWTTDIDGQTQFWDSPLQASNRAMEAADRMQDRDDALFDRGY